MLVRVINIYKCHRGGGGTTPYDFMYKFILRLYSETVYILDYHKFYCKVENWKQLAKIEEDNQYLSRGGGDEGKGKPW